METSVDLRWISALASVRGPASESSPFMTGRQADDGHGQHEQCWMMLAWMLGWMGCWGFSASSMCISTMSELVDLAGGAFLGR
jgi:hypothetical protein